MSLQYYLLSFLSGLAVALQVGINGQLRSNIGSPILASLVSFLVGSIGLCIVFCYTLANGTYALSTLSTMKDIRWWMFTGGLLGAFYIFTTIISPSKIGFANMFSLAICGQIILAVIFDHFGLMGNKIHLISPLRIIGMVLLVSGVYIIQKY
ncbi:MAG: DMT family transporter [Lachnospiraceae bacterium]|nr:DMT family transporter [Lachnospiraceae bacterium]